ncbi:hypothetical protein KEM54_001947 [Ascosphaera aggregata]|nr:hypothetical protein KEM54_001947 [Ascosphaera aggregata]
MLLIDNFVHSDLHPGNIMVRFYRPHQLDMLLKARARNQNSNLKMLEDETKFVLSRLFPVEEDPEEWNEELRLIKSEGYKPQIVFLDTGLVTELSDINRQNFLALFQAVAEFDGYRAGKLMIERCRQPDAAIDPDVFALRMQNLVLDLKRRTFALSNVSIGDVLGQVLSMVHLLMIRSAIPILRRLGAESTLIDSVRQGDTSMLRVWLGIEARALMQASVESVERCVTYDLLSPNI